MSRFGQEAQPSRWRPVSRAAGQAVVAALLLAGCAGRSREKVVVIGLDGATFDLVKPWVREGKLPALARLLQEGAHGGLVCPIPPSSASAWTSAVTGVNPGKHGLFGFMHVLFEPGGDSLGTTVFANSRDRGAEPVWSILGRAGRKVGLINIPLTSPPDSVAGFMISGFPHPNPDDYAYPPELKREILNYRLDAYGQEAVAGLELPYLALVLDVESQREQVALRLLREKEWDLFWVVFTGTDRVQHYYWKFMDPRDPRYDSQAPETLRNAVLLMYQRLDEAVGKILAAVDDRTTVLVISDHGFGPANRQVMGDLVARGLGAGGPVQVYTTDNFGAKYALRFRQPPPHSAADSAAYRSVREELVRRLRELTDPATGEKVLARVWLREELYHGPYVEEASDVIGMEREGYLFLNWLKDPGEELVLPADEHFFSGFHRLEGILLAQGPEVAAGKAVEGCELMDLTPTILALLQVPLPDNLDGKVLTGLFQPGWAEKHRPGTQPAVEVARRAGGPGGDLARQLRAVGYLR